MPIPLILILMVMILLLTFVHAMTNSFTYYHIISGLIGVMLLVWVCLSPQPIQVNYHDISFFESEDCYGAIVDSTFINATKFTGTISLNPEIYHIKESKVSGWSNGLYWPDGTPTYSVVKKKD